MNEYQDHPKERDPSGRNKTGVLVIAAWMLVASFAGGIIALWIYGANNSKLNAGANVAILEGIRNNATINTVEVNTDELKTAAQVYAQNVNSTVGITTSVTTNFWGYQTTTAASGSGFIVSSDGYILTNHHVVENSERILVTLFDSESYEATLVGYDESNDIAVLKIDAKGLSPVIFGDSDQLNVGEDVIAIGNPLGELTFSLTAGKISAKDREVTFSNGGIMNLLQTDCAINSGNSGGALFNLYGEVVGVTNAKYSGSSGGGASIDNIGFAIPVNTARVIMESIIEKGYVSKPYIGITVTDVTEDHLLYGLPTGAVVRGVEKDSPAQQAGLEIGDIITKVDAIPIQGSRELVRILRECAVGQTLRLTVYQKGENKQITVTVAEGKQSTDTEH